MITARILIVEDEAILAADMQEILQRMGHTIVGVAASGQAAMTQALRVKPELILMDINLQGPLDGIETARLLREACDSVPVIFLTSYSDSETVARARETEPFGYLLKPFDEALLQITIDVALYKHSMEQDRERLRRELDEARSEIQTLSGLLPICAYCKSVRNDAGYWEQIESYISLRTPAVFSHGICTKCLAIHHPDAAQRQAPENPANEGGA
jgi:CheY-like chemotaxis protein